MSFTEAQVEQLLRAIAPSRVMHAQGQSHVSQQDIRAHLSRIFGFGFWDKEIVRLEQLRDVVVTIPPQPAKADKPAKPERKVPGVSYLAVLRLTIYCPTRCCKSVHEDVGTGTSPNLPDYGDAHDFASKNAVSYALKRCAIDFGDQFGLSLYNKGQTAPLVKGTLIGAPVGTAESRETGDVQEGVPQQVSLGEHDTESADQDRAPSGGPIDRRTAEQVEADETRAEILQFIEARNTKLGEASMPLWNPQEVAATFRKEHKRDIRYGTPAQLTQFLQDIQLEAQREDEEYQGKRGAA